VLRTPAGVLVLVLMPTPAVLLSRNVPGELVAVLQEELTIELQQTGAKDMLSALGGTPRCFERFLLARNLNVSAAALQFRQTLKFRQSFVHKAIPLAEATRTKVAPFWPGCFCGRTRTTAKHPCGLPIQYFRFGEINPRGMMAAVSEDQFRAYYVHWMELALRHENSCNPVPGTCSLDRAAMIEVHDMKGLHLSQLHMPGLRMLSRVLSIGQNHYPENLYRCVIINAPTVFAIAWRVISTVLTERTRAKIDVLADGGTAKLAQITGLEPEQVTAMFENAVARSDPEGHGWLDGREVHAEECGLRTVNEASPQAIRCTEVQTDTT
jgi:hypothetical protein